MSDRIRTRRYGATDLQEGCRPQHHKRGSRAMPKEKGNRGIDYGEPPLSDGPAFSMGRTEVARAVAIVLALEPNPPLSGVKAPPHLRTS